MRHHPVPPQEEDIVRLGVEDVSLEVAHQRPLLGRVGLAQHLVVEVDLLGALKICVIGGVDRAWQVSLDVEERVDDALAVAGHTHVEIAVAKRFEPWPGGYDALRDLEPDLAPLVDDPGPIILVGLIDIPVEQLKAEPFGPGILQETLSLGP
jgi:hypothetical protein